MKCWCVGTVTYSSGSCHPAVDSATASWAHECGGRVNESNARFVAPPNFHPLTEMPANRVKKQIFKYSNVWDANAGKWGKPAERNLG